MTAEKPKTEDRMKWRDDGNWPPPFWQVHPEITWIVASSCAAFLAAAFLFVWKVWPR